jgi:hypothetical protein
VGRTRARSRLWFTLRHGGAPHQSLQAAWRTHGAESFGFDIFEQIEDEPSAHLRDAALKERLAHWSAKLQAEALLGQASKRDHAGAGRRI